MQGEPWDDEPDEWDEQVADDCEHDDADFDILTGELTCRCGYRRVLTGDEFQRESALRVQIMESYDREASDGR